MALVLGESDVRQLLRMPALIDAMEDALRAFSSGDAQQPLRTVMQVGEAMSFFAVMPAFVHPCAAGAARRPAALGTKVVSMCAGNTARDLPTHLATILLNDPATGELLAILDGRYITEARTAAASAASTRVLGKEDASVLAILGSGVQARSHLEALALVRPLREVRVWSRDAAHRERFADAHRGAADRVRAVGSAREAVDGADLIVTATAAAEPVLRGEWVAAGAHVCAVGSCRPNLRELDADLVGRARVFVDSRAGALAEAGDLVMAIADGRFSSDRIAGELGEVFAGRVPGRTSRDEITLFESLGMAVEDVAAANLVYQRAVETGLGRGLIL